MEGAQPQEPAHVGQIPEAPLVASTGPLEDEHVHAEEEGQYGGCREETGTEGFVQTGECREKCFPQSAR